MTRGFLLGATAGRTTLQGEGLQHDDGHILDQGRQDDGLAALQPPLLGISVDPAYEADLLIAQCAAFGRAACRRDGADAGRSRVGTDVVAPPSYSGATWVGQRTDQKTFARPYATRRTEPARQDTESSRAAAAPRTAAARRRASRGRQR